MKWFLDLSMRSKLFVCFGLIFALMAWVIATAYSSIAAIHESQDRLYQEDFANVRDLANLRTLQNLIRVEILEALLAKESSERVVLLRDAAGRTKQIDMIMAGLPARARNDPKSLSKIEELKSVQKAFTQTKDDEITPLILAGKIAKAQQLAVGVQQPRSEKMRAISAELSQAAEERARQAEARTNLQENHTFRIFLWVAIATLLTGVLLALLLERVIAGPLRLLSAAAGRVAAGDLSIEVEQIDRGDEVGGLVLAFRTMVESQRQIMREILEGVSVLKESEKRITRLNRLYTVLSGINTAIIRTPERQTLFEEACRIAVEHGQFRMAWIGLLAPDGITVMPVAKAGIEEGYLDNIRLSAIADAPDGCKLVARALQEQTAVLCNDIDSDPQMARWREEALRRGYRSIAILPLQVGEKVVGLLLLYASETDFFDREEMALLTELAGDISFALDHFEKEQRLNYLAYYDVLTGLPNRTLLYDRLDQGEKAARRNEWLLAVLFVDLDNFKTINDTLGHTIGDALLQEVARRLASCLRDTDTVGRLGGDEFCIILPEIGSSEDAAMVARKVIQSCARPHLIEGHELFISASVGITLFPDDAVDCETMIRNADTAMYRAKDSGRNTYQFFTEEMNQSTQEKMRLETDLRYALAKGEFLLHYQPKVSCVSGKITGFEALLRWQHPARGLVGPNEFIPALEETGLIVQVGAWVLSTACVQAKRWHDAGLGTPSVAVNISGRQMHVADLCETVRQALDMSGLAPAYLDLELTESYVMKDAEGNIGILKQLKAMGVQISVDDFGTGYSSLAYLKRFPIDALKIDRSFVKDIIADQNDAAITRAIIFLAHNLSLKVVAEGIETEGQLGLLIANHCDEIQGYYFSRPLPAEDAFNLLREGGSLASKMYAELNP